MTPTWLRWVVWGSAASIFFVATFHRVAPGTVAKDVMQSFDVSGRLLGHLSAAYFYVYAVLVIPAGILVDSLGPRRTIASGGGLMGVGALLMGAADGIAGLFLGRIFIGAGASVAFVGALNVAAARFPSRDFGTMSTMTSAIGVLGGLCATVPLAVLTSFLGWRQAFQAVGAATIAASLVCWWIVRDTEIRAARSVKERTALWSERSPLRAAVRGTMAVLTNRSTWPPFASFFFTHSWWYNLSLWIVPFLRDSYGLTTAHAASYAMASPLAFLVSAPLIGFLSDRIFRRRRLVYVGLCWMAVIAWMLLLSTIGRTPLWAVYVELFALGVAVSGSALTAPIAREVNPPSLGATSVAAITLGGFLGVAVTQGPVGSLLDSRWDGTILGGNRVYPLSAYAAVFEICGAFSLVAALVAFLVRETHGHNIYMGPRATTACRPTQMQ